MSVYLSLKKNRTNDRRVRVYTSKRTELCFVDAPQMHTYVRVRPPLPLPPLVTPPASHSAAGRAPRQLFPHRRRSTGKNNDGSVTTRLVTVFFIIIHFFFFFLPYLAIVFSPMGRTHDACAPGHDHGTVVPWPMV